jgi:hypothetical protein
MPCDGMKSFSEPRQFNFSLNPIYSNHATSLSQSLQNTNALNRSCNSLTICNVRFISARFPNRMR